MSTAVTEDCPCFCDFHQLVFDAIPSAIFVVQADLSIADFNDAAIRLPEDALLSAIRPDWEGDRIGDILHCIDSTKGCGNSPACRSCEMVHGARRALAGQVVRKVIRIDTNRNDGPAHHEYLMTAARVQRTDRSMALLMLEDRAAWAI